MTTIRDVANRAGVSPATVSRVINKHPAVNPAIRDLVLEAIEALQFEPNLIARTLRTAKTSAIGLLLSDIRNADLSAAGFWGAEAAAREHGYALMAASAGRDPSEYEERVKKLLQRRIDGLLCTSAIPFTLVHDLVTRVNVPAVMFTAPNANPLVPAAVLTFESAVQEAVNHLVELRHRRIATVTHTRQTGQGVDIAWGVPLIRRALQARGINPNPRMHHGVESPADCTRVVHDLYSSSMAPTALLVTTLNLIPATFAGLRAAGVSVPEDVSLIAFGDPEWAPIVDPPLSVIAADIPAHLDSATRLLIRLIDKQEIGQPTPVHEARYIRRASVGPARAHLHQGTPE